MTKCFVICGIHIIDAIQLSKTIRNRSAELIAMQTSTYENCIYSIFSLARLPSVAGIEPDSWQEFRSKSVSCVRFPNESGIPPVKRLLNRYLRIRIAYTVLSV